MTWKYLCTYLKPGLLENGEIWMQMITSRNLTSHAYDEKIAEEIIVKIINIYYSEIAGLISLFSKKLKEE